MRTESNTTQVMTPEHPRWPQFRNGLGNAIKHRGCDHTLRHTRILLEVLGFGDEEIEASVADLTSRGGYCDCELILNVEAKPTPANELVDRLLSPEGQKQARRREQAYSRGVTHGLEAVRRIAAGSGSVSLAEIDTVSDIAMEMRFDGEGHPAFLDELLGRRKDVVTNA